MDGDRLAIETRRFVEMTLAIGGIGKRADDFCLQALLAERPHDLQGFLIELRCFGKSALLRRDLARAAQAIRIVFRRFPAGQSQNLLVPRWPSCW